MPYSMGLVRQKPDPRDLKLKAPSPRMLAALPATLDFAPRMGPQLDQGRLGSCGPNTATESIDFEQIIANQKKVHASRLFTYYNTRMLMGTINQDSGVDNRNMLKALNRYGFCDETLWPYSDDQTTFKKKPSQACYDSALGNKITNYAGVAVNLQAMKAALATASLIVFGTEVFKGFMTPQAEATGIVLNPGRGESPLGGHDISFCGYTDVDMPGIIKGNVWPQGTFRFRNHWMKGDGTPWGDGGYGYLRYDYSTNTSYVSDLWVIDTVPGAIEDPVNPPDPPSPPVPGPGGSIAAGSYLLPAGCTLIVPGNVAKKTA